MDQDEKIKPHPDFKNKTGSRQKPRRSGFKKPDPEQIRILLKTESKNIRILWKTETKTYPDSIENRIQNISGFY